MSLSVKLGLIACAALALTPAEAATKMRIMYTAANANAVVFVAKDQGFFEKRGLDVELILAPQGSAVIAGIVSGSVESGTPTATVFLQAVDSGLDQVAVAATNAFPETSPSGLLARTNSNIKSAKDLVGKKVGVPGLNGLLDVVFRKWLADQGVDTKRVSYAEIAFPQMNDALKSAQVDAVVAIDPFYARIMSQDSGYLVAEYTKWLPNGTIAGLFSMTSKWVAANSQAVKAFQEALVEGVAFTKANLSATHESIARYTKLPPQVVAAQPLPNLVAKITAQDLKFWVDLMKERGMLTTTPDVAKAVMPWQASN